MIKLLPASIALLLCLTVGCSSKTVTMTATGDSQVVTVTDASKYSDAQSQAWSSYYKAVANPPVIAKITQLDGTVIDIHSQVPPPTPSIKQHKNQVIEPLERMVSTGVKIIGGGLVVKEIVDSMQGVSISNSGDGNVTYDRSEPVSIETTTVSGSTIKENSDNPDTVTEDNHVEKADPIVVTNTDKTTTTTTSTLTTSTVQPTTDSEVIE